VKAFEESFAAYCGTTYAVGVCNGTVALHAALVALGVGKGDEVIIPDFTMIASAFAVAYTGAKAVFVDADPLTWNIDVTKIEEKITKKTKAIMPVHIFGNPCDMDAIRSLACAHKIAVIEDAAEAHGATYRGTKTGALSDLAAFSFFANKNLTTGEGGMVTTSNKDLYDRVRYFKNLCFPLDAPRVYEHADIGFNYRLTNLHAAIGLAQVEKADDYRAMRIKNHGIYRRELAGTPGIVFQEDTRDAQNVHWMNTIKLESRAFGISRDALVAHLKGVGIETRLLFTGMHRQKSLLDLGCDGSGAYAVTDDLTANGLYLPSASNLKEDDVVYVCDAIKKARCA
jgi:perosamine synthetase